MRRGLVGIALLLGVLLVGTWWLAWGPPPPTTAPDATSKTTVERARVEPERPRGGSVDAAARAKRVREGAVAREAMRQRIAAAEAARTARAAAMDAPSVDDEAPAEAPTAPRKPPAEAPAEPQEPPLLDRTGNHAYLARVLKDDLIPLVDECYALARETQPELAGMIDLNVDIVGDPEVGGVIDSVAVAPTNELTDPALLECVRESMFSVTLPPPESGGRDGLMLSLRLDPEE